MKRGRRCSSLRCSCRRSDGSTICLSLPHRCLLMADRGRLPWRRGWAGGAFSVAILLLYLPMEVTVLGQPSRVATLVLLCLHSWAALLLWASLVASPMTPPPRSAHELEPFRASLAAADCARAPRLWHRHGRECRISSLSMRRSPGLRRRRCVYPSGDSENDRGERHVGDLARAGGLCVVVAGLDAASGAPARGWGELRLDAPRPEHPRGCGAPGWIGRRRPAAARHGSRPLVAARRSGLRYAHAGARAARNGNTRARRGGRLADWPRGPVERPAMQAGCMGRRDE